MTSGVGIDGINAKPWLDEGESIHPWRVEAERVKVSVFPATGTVVRLEIADPAVAEAVLLKDAVWGLKSAVMFWRASVLGVLPAVPITVRVKVLSPVTVWPA